MTARSPRLRSPRQEFMRRRLRVTLASIIVGLALGGLGVLLASPEDLGAVRWGGVGLAWWGAMGALGLQALALVIGGDRSRSPDP